MELYINEFGVPPTLPTSWAGIGTTLAAYLASSSPPVPPGSPTACDNGAATGPITTDCYMLCINPTAGAETYLLAARDETSSAIDGDVDTNLAYTALQCILSNKIVGTANAFVATTATCADPVFCLGR
jgi:hypothetical protein